MNLPIRERIEKIINDYCFCSSGPCEGWKKDGICEMRKSWIDQILTAIKETLLQEIPTITRDLTSAPTHGLPKSKSNRILNEAIERVLGKKEI